MLSHFETSKGSVYEILDGGERTKRWKRVSDENCNESTRTFYLTPSDAAYLLAGLDLGMWVKLEESSLYITVPSYDPQFIVFESKPKKGLSPLEVWGDLQNPETLHVGNEIVDIW